MKLLLALIVTISVQHNSPRQLKPWAQDLARTTQARACLRYHESYGQTHPYKVRNLQGYPVYGAYQYKDGTWRGIVRAARKYYRNYLTRARRASQAPAWVQDVVTAFAVAHYPRLVSWKPWPYCY